MSSCHACGHKLETSITKKGDRITMVVVDGIIYRQPMLITDTYQTKVCSDDPDGRPVFTYSFTVEGEGECICDTAQQALEGLLEEQEIFIDAYQRALRLS